MHEGNFLVHRLELEASPVVEKTFNSIPSTGNVQLLVIKTWVWIWILSKSLNSKLEKK